MTLPQELLIRDYETDDLSFFYNALLHHYKHSSPHTKIIPDKIYYEAHQKIIARVLERAGNFLKFAALKDDPTVVFGFVWGSTRPHTVHYVYVKRAFRRMGIARALCREALNDSNKIYYTHLTYDGGHITQTRSQFIFNPYLLHGAEWKSKLDDEADPEKLLMRM